MRRLLGGDRLPFTLAFVSLVLARLTHYIDLGPTQFGLAGFSFAHNGFMGRLSHSIHDLSYPIAWVSITITAFLSYILWLRQFSRSVSQLTCQHSKSLTHEYDVVWGCLRCTAEAPHEGYARIFLLPRWQRLFYLMPAFTCTIITSTMMSIGYYFNQNNSAIDFFLTPINVIIPFELLIIGYRFRGELFEALRELRQREIITVLTESWKDVTLFYLICVLGISALCGGPVFVGQVVHSLLWLLLFLAATLALGYVYRTMWQGATFFLVAFFPRLRTWRMH